VVLERDGWRSCSDCRTTFFAPWCHRCGDLAIVGPACVRCEACVELDVLDAARAELLRLLERRARRLAVLEAPPRSVEPPPASPAPLWRDPGPAQQRLF
jgi:hypothetical protein